MALTKIIENKVCLVEFNDCTDKIYITPRYEDKYFETAIICLMYDVENERTLEYKRFAEYTNSMSKKHKEVFDKIFEFYKKGE